MDTGAWGLQSVGSHRRDFHRRNRVCRPQCWARPGCCSWAHAVRTPRPQPQPSEQRPGPGSLRSGLLKPRGGPLFLSPFSASEARKGVKQNLFSKQKEFSRE